MRAPKVYGRQKCLLISQAKGQGKCMNFKGRSNDWSFALFRTYPSEYGMSRRFLNGSSNRSSE